MLRNWFKCPLKVKAFAKTKHVFYIKSKPGVLLHLSYGTRSLSSLLWTSGAQRSLHWQHENERDICESELSTNSTFKSDLKERGVFFFSFYLLLWERKVKWKKIALYSKELIICKVVLWVLFKRWCLFSTESAKKKRKEQQRKSVG